MMQRDEYLEAITRESTALADAAERAGLDVPVPSCPGWTVADLVAHVGEVQQWARITVEQRATERISRRTLPSAPSGSALVPWFREQAPSLIAELAATDPATPVWSWSADNTAHFWFRRQAHEVAVHRWDAELAGGTQHAIDAALAADGIDECLATFLDGDRAVGTGETVHLHCVDADGEWVITLTERAPKIERAHAKADVAARGAASDLELFLWGRVESSALDVFGDRELLDRFRSAIRG
jgi:uncharacterized protein (TIGR03083 family)